MILGSEVADWANVLDVGDDAASVH